MKKALEEIGGSESERERGKKLGQEAAVRVVKARAGDGADQVGIQELSV